MKALSSTLAVVVLAALAGTGCTTPSSAQSNHWTVQSVGPRITYTLFGYDGTRDGTGGEFAGREAGSVSRTLKRRLLNINPDNPLTASD